MEYKKLLENFKFNKNFGQNFIFDGNLLSAIVSDAGITENDEVLEIGTGMGTLTSALCKKAKKVVSYEIDKKLTEILTALKSENSNLEIVMQDALKTPIEEIEKNFSGKYKIVANLPYYITSPLIFKFVENNTNAQSLTIMVQKEVAERFAAAPCTEGYGVSGVMLSYYATTTYMRTVARTNFHPQPKVDSAVIKIEINHNLPRAKSDEMFRQVVKAAFAMRRKTLLNNLSMAFPIGKDAICKVLESLNILPTARAETLTKAQFIEIANKLTN